MSTPTTPAPVAQPLDTPSVALAKEGKPRGVTGTILTSDTAGAGGGSQAHVIQPGLRADALADAGQRQLHAVSLRGSEVSEVGAFIGGTDRGWAASQSATCCRSAAL